MPPAAASPLRHAAAIKAPVLVVYPGLDHQLDDSGARTDLLERSDRFLRAALNMPTGG